MLESNLDMQWYKEIHRTLHFSKSRGSVDFLSKAQCMNDDHVCMQRVGDKHSTLQSIWVWVLCWLKSVGTKPRSYFGWCVICPWPTNYQALTSALVLSWKIDLSSFCNLSSWYRTLQYNTFLIVVSSWGIPTDSELVVKGDCQYQKLNDISLCRQFYQNYSLKIWTRMRFCEHEWLQLLQRRNAYSTIWHLLGLCTRAVMWFPFRGPPRRLT